MVQYLIQIREKVKSEENNPLVKEIAMKISSLEEERRNEKVALIDFIDNYKTIIINMPVEEKREPKVGILRRLFK